MSETPKPIQPVGRSRRIAGNVLMGLGVALWADVVWLFMAFSPRFNYENWLRFWFLLWIGTAFVPAGYWLRSRSRAALWTAVLVFVGTIAFLFCFDYWVRNLAPPPP